VVLLYALPVNYSLRSLTEKPLKLKTFEKQMKIHHPQTERQTAALFLIQSSPVLFLIYFMFFQ
jgi:hypothetical protein